MDSSGSLKLILQVSEVAEARQSGYHAPSMSHLSQNDRSRPVIETANPRMWNQGEDTRVAH